ncbi:MAG: SRPBCC family protein [Cucumibacter sp.]
MSKQQTISPAPVKRTVRVKASPSRAFEVFAAGMGKWWPKRHAIGASPLADVIVEPRAGGRFYERGEDGCECEWGRVIAYEPGKRVALGWQLDADWRHDPDFEVEIEVTFKAEGKATLVSLEHRNLERYGERAEEAAASLGGDSGWTGLLASYAEAVSASA